jgi:hypothetical protein
MLEGQMQDLRNLPERLATVELQFVQLRQEMRDGFSAIRTELKTGDEETRAFMRILHEDVLSRLEVIGEGDGSDGSGQ